LQQSNQQHKTKQLGWCGIIIGKKTTTTPHHHHTTPPPHHTTTTPEWLHFKQLPGNLVSWVFVCSLISQLEEIWKTTSIFLKMEDDLNFLFLLRKTTLISLKTEEDLKKICNQK
jgi:hypothetical protein